MKTQDKKDEFIRNLVRVKGIEKAPDHFTDKVMGKLQAKPVIDDTPLLSTGTWIAIIAGIAAMVVVIFTVDIPFVDQMFSSTNIEKVSMNIFNNGFLETMATFFKNLNVSNVTWMIIAAALGLVGLERLLRKRFTETGMLIL